MYLAAKLHKEMEEVLPPEKLIGHEISYSDLSKMLNTFLKPFNAKGRVAKDVALNRRKKCAFDVSGYFDLDRKKTPVVITIHVPKNKKAIMFTKDKYNTFLFDLSRVIQHEFIHRSQFTFRPEESSRSIQVPFSRNIGKKRKENIIYLSEWCEVEAYAHDIALEIKWFYPQKNPYSVIQNIDKYKKLQSYNYYKKVFRSTDWERVKKSLLRKVVKWVPSAKPPERL